MRYLGEFYEQVAVWMTIDLVAFPFKAQDCLGGKPCLYLNLFCPLDTGAVLWIVVLLHSVELYCPN